MEKTFLIVLLALSPSLLLGHPSDKIGLKRVQSLNSLSKSELVHLKVLKRLVPRAIPKPILDAFTKAEEGDPIYPYDSIDDFFLDARQLFTQTKKTSDTTTLPEFKYYFALNFCLWFWCINIDVNFASKNTRFLGSDTVTSENQITPDTFTNIFKVGHFNWTSPGYMINVTDYDAQRIHLTQNSFYSFENISIAFSLKYEHVPEIGIQVSNLTIHFNPGRVIGGVRELTIWDFNGNLQEQEYVDLESNPIHREMASYWEYDKRSYRAGLEASLNCVLVS